MTKGLQELLEKFGVKDAESFETELNKVLAETHVPKSVFNETNEKLKTAKQESADKDKLLEEAKKGGADFETLKSQYDELVKKHKADEERHEAEMLATRKGFDLSDYDLRCLDYAKEYATRLLAIDVNIPINEMLDTAWELFGKYFTKAETGLKEKLIEKYWKEK